MDIIVYVKNVEIKNNWAFQNKFKNKILNYKEGGFNGY